MFSKISKNQVSKSIEQNKRSVPLLGNLHFSSEKDVHCLFLKPLIYVSFLIICGSGLIILSFISHFSFSCLIIRSRSLVPI